MFWKFGFHNASAIEGIIEKEGATLDDVMREDELLQEVKAQNAKLLELYLSLTYPFVASEIFGCEIMTIIDALFQNQDVLTDFWKFLEKEDNLNSLNATYFAKINTVLLTKKTAAMVGFLKESPTAYKSLVKHLNCNPIADLILNIIKVEDLPEGQGVLKWLRDQGLIMNLVSLLDPKLDAECHTIASQTLIDIITLTYQPANAFDPTAPPEVARPSGGNNNLLIMEMKTEKILTQLIDFMLDRTSENCTTSLINGISVIMELIRRYCSEIESAEVQHHEFNVRNQNGNPNTPYPGLDKIIALSIDLNDLFYGQPVDTTVGKQIPLGSERLKICELFAEFIHLQYLFASSPLFDMMVCPTDDESAAPEVTVVDGLIMLTESFIREKIMERCIGLFFAFPWNNFIHSVVYDMIAKIFNTYSFTANLAGQYGYQKTPSEAALNEMNDEPSFAQLKMKVVRQTVKKLIVSIFQSGTLIQQITNAQRLNDYHVEQPKGFRLGYMGHLTYISEETCKLFEKCAEELDDELHNYIHSEEWHEYVNHTFRQTQEADRQTLGGTKPEQVGGVSAFGGAGSAVDDDFKSKPVVLVKSSVHDIDDDNAEKNLNSESVDAYHDQFTRYLCQQMVKDLPDRFMGADSSDDEEEKKWIGDVEDKEVEFDINEAISQDALYAVRNFHRDGDDETMSDDLESVQQEMEDFPTSAVPDSQNDPARNLPKLVEGIETLSPTSTAGKPSSWEADFSNMKVSSDTPIPSNPLTDIK
ncbi:hypothetical protein HK103_006423 [Boothiomyces macroporosus]|uniref:SAPS-domain-containing protein n=1 Tax=Boothiomyces macroporosus TaxID=261099 RepID=A0AAD5UL26_9FUNG|nr:hypothetical protein HK103_006423 [Boothiomyces macroporosus]